VTLHVNVRPQPRRSHCQRGHEFTDANTLVAVDGTRRCRACQQASRARQKRNRVEERVQVVCPSCDHIREVARRNARKIEQGASSGRCDDCRYGRNLDPVAPAAPAEDLVQWWRDAGFTPREAREIWAGLSLLVPSTYDDDALRRAA
jgi:hypothetical protein